MTEAGVRGVICDVQALLEPSKFVNPQFGEELISIMSPPRHCRVDEIVESAYGSTPFSIKFPFQQQRQHQWFVCKVCGSTFRGPMKRILITKPVYLSLQDRLVYEIIKQQQPQPPLPQPPLPQPPQPIQDLVLGEHLAKVALETFVTPQGVSEGTQPPLEIDPTPGSCPNLGTVQLPKDPEITLEPPAAPVLGPHHPPMDQGMDPETPKNGPYALTSCHIPGVAIISDFSSLRIILPMETAEMVVYMANQAWLDGWVCGRKAAAKGTAK